MAEFLELLAPGQALERLLQHLPPVQPQNETLPTVQALGRVTAFQVTSPERLPAFRRSTVDGYAVLARDTFGASDNLPGYFELVGEVPMGQCPDFRVGSGHAALIHTGGMLPEGADAVVMLEHTQSARPGEVEIMRAVAPGENVLHPGEDVEVGQDVLPAGQILRAAEIGGLLALGIESVMVACRPRVGILSSGDEVVAPALKPEPGQVRDINSYTLAALVEGSGGSARLYGIIPDRADVLEACMRTALDACDLVVITAGSSASTRDLTAAVIGRMGLPGVLVHGVNVKPGKPTILGVCGGKTVIGLPGNPVSALVIARLFVQPVIERLLGLKAGRLIPSVPARLSVNLASQTGREDFIPVHLVFEGSGYRAEPIFYKSNLIFTLVQADGLVRIPADATGLEADTSVLVELL